MPERFPGTRFPGRRVSWPAGFLAGGFPGWRDERQQKTVPETEPAHESGPAPPSALSFRVAAWAAWTEAGEAPAGSAVTTGAPAGSQARLPAGLRRRATAIGRRALDTAVAILPAGAHPRLVLSSRHGEYERTDALLQSLARDGAVSPAEFSMSVHHGLLGLLSIATRNRAGHTALAAGPDSFGYGLLEAAACAVEAAAPVLLIHFDQPLPEAYAPVVEDDTPPLVLALLIVAPAGGPRAGGEPETGDAMSLALEPATAAAARPEPPGSLAGGPPGGLANGLAAAFLDFLSSHDPEIRIPGERLTWRWRRDA
jgi:hypothetical protein